MQPAQDIAQRFYWSPGHERTLLWNDPALGISWPLAGEPVLSTKDRAGVPLAQADGQPGRAWREADQFRAPTWSRTVAETTVRLLAQSNGRAWWDENAGLYHLASRGSTSWHGFAQAFMDEASVDCEVEPISTAEYPTAARRPPYSVLDCGKLETRFGPIPEWREALRLCLR